MYAPDEFRLYSAYAKERLQSPEHCPSCSSSRSTSSWSSSTSSEDDPSRSSLILPAARASAAFCPPLIRKPSPTARSEGSVPPLLVRTAWLLSLYESKDWQAAGRSSTGCSTRSPARSPHKANQELAATKKRLAEQEEVVLGLDHGARSTRHALVGLKLGQPCCCRNRV